MILGIDPGVSGALAALDIQRRHVEVIDVPVFTIKGKRSLDHASLWRWLQTLSLDGAIIERVGAMPGQGVVSMFNFGAAFGALTMAVSALSVPWSFVQPAVWKSALNVPADKDGARLRATQLLPWAADRWPLKKDHNKAEATLIAYFGSKNYEPGQTLTA